VKLDPRTRIRLLGDLKVLAEGGYPMKAEVGECVLILQANGTEPLGPAVVNRVQEFWDDRHDQHVRFLQVFDPDNPGQDIDGEAKWNLQVAYDYGCKPRMDHDLERGLRPVETIRIPNILDLIAFLRRNVPGAPETLLVDEGLLLRVGKDRHLIRQEGKEPLIVPIITAAAEYMRGILRKTEERKERVAPMPGRSFPETGVDEPSDEADETDPPELIEPKPKKPRFSKDGQ